MPGNIVLCPSKIRLFTTPYANVIYAYFPKRDTTATSVLLSYAGATWRIYDRNWRNHITLDANLARKQWRPVLEDRVPALKQGARAYAQKMIAQGKLP